MNSDYETSAEVGEFAKALVAAQIAMPAAVKDARTARTPHRRPSRERCSSSF